MGVALFWPLGTLLGSAVGKLLPAPETIGLDAATVLLFSVAIATTFYENDHFSGIARVTGVAIAVFLAWRKVPLIAVIIISAAITATLRQFGVA
ncbi:hypothetical protein [Buttiauxella agrestis]|uniref:hypothetical protein n=1 Tax=Buttiauxella agrestis TaxID=82977 RepID=UPI00055141E7